MALANEIDISTSFLQRHLKDFKEEDHLEAVEDVCWGVLSNPKHNLENLQLIHLMGAIHTHDVKGIQILLRCLRGSNAMLRAQAVKYAAMFRDDILKEEILSLMKHEKNWYVRLELIKSIGALKMEEGKQWLKDILLKEQYTHEEKAFAIQSLIMIYERIEKKELSQILTSPRFGLRELAPMIVMHLKLDEYLEDIQPLLFDSSPHVRIATICCVATLNHFSYDQPLIDKLKSLLADKHPIVSLTAAWALSSIDQQNVETSLKEKLQDSHPEIRRLAASVLGKNILLFPNLAKEAMESKDEFVRLNVAIGAHNHQVFLNLASKHIMHILEDESLFIMKDQYTHPFFEFYTKSQVSHIPYIQDYPKLINGATRIQLIKRLFELKNKKALSLLKNYLTNQIWGLTFESSATLLQEVELEKIEELDCLLKDENPKIRIQAALAKGFATKDSSVMPILIEGYKDLDGNMKLTVLEAIGHIGSKEAIDFLVEQLNDPFQLTKIVSASAIIQSIYH